MLKLATLVAPMVLGNKSADPVKLLGGFALAAILGALAAIFLLAAGFAWIATNIGVDVAFLTIALLLAIFAGCFALMAKREADFAKAQEEARSRRVQAMLAQIDDPLTEHIPNDVLEHPLSQKILAQVEDKPWVASAAAVGVGMMLSKGMLDDA